MNRNSFQAIHKPKSRINQHYIFHGAIPIIHPVHICSHSPGRVISKDHISLTDMVQVYVGCPYIRWVAGTFYETIWPHSAYYRLLDISKWNLIHISLIRFLSCLLLLNIPFDFIYFFVVVVAAFVSPSTFMFRPVAQMDAVGTVIQSLGECMAKRPRSSATSINHQPYIFNKIPFKSKPSKRIFCPRIIIY